jgi:predicted RNA-binding Zn-ribbon protein involved in translation (DUF1610 family)
MDLLDTRAMFADLDSRVARLEKAIPPKAISIFAMPCPKCGSELKPPVTPWKSAFGPDVSWRDGFVLLLDLLILVGIVILRAPVFNWNGFSEAIPREESPKKKNPWRCMKCGHECNR